MNNISSAFTNLVRPLIKPFQKKSYNPLSDFFLSYAGCEFTESIHTSSSKYGILSIKIEHNGRCHLNCELLKANDPRNAQVKKLVFDMLQYKGHLIPERFEFLKKHSENSRLPLKVAPKAYSNSLANA